MKLTARLALLFAPGALLAALTGCSGMYTTAIATPGSVPAPPAGAPAVTLVVSDRRPPNEGGKDPKRVGTIRALAGNGAGMREESPDAVRRLVEAATKSGLAKAGIGTADAKPPLEVAISKFWMDGYSSYTAELWGTLRVRKDGQDAWSRDLKVNATGEQAGSPSEMFNRVWGWALDKWRDEVARAMAEPDALAALGMKPPAAVAPAEAPKAGTAGPVGLSVASEFSFDDRQRLTFEIMARNALKKAGLTDARGAFPEVTVRYVSVYEKNAKTGNVNGYKVTTRLSLKDAAGQILWEDSFVVKGTLGDLDPKNVNYVDASFSTSVDYEWTTEVVRRLKSEAFRKAAGR